MDDQLKVSQLKEVLRFVGLSTTGKKAILQDRVKDQLSFYLRRGAIEEIEAVNAAILSIVNFGVIVPSDPHVGRAPPPPTYSQQVNNLSGNTTNERSVSYIPFGTNEAINNNFHSVGGFRPLAALQNGSSPRPPQIIFPVVQNSRRGTSQSSVSMASKMSFIPSPFFKVLQILHAPIMLFPPYIPRSTHSGNFVLPTELLSTIMSGSLKIYFLSQDFDESSNPKFIEFPTLTEVSLNGSIVPANTRGIKGKAGTTRPVDLTPKVLDSRSKARHAIDVTIAFPMNNGRIKDEVQKHVWAMAAYLVQPIPIEKLVEELLDRPKISKQQVIEMIKEENSDEDIVATSTVKGLKDPISYKKMDIPIRAVTCTHIDCFDAQSYFLLQMTASTWDCPVCNKHIKYEDLAVDEYFTEILERTASNVGEVEVMPDGTWTSIKSDDSDMDDTDDETAVRPKSMVAPPSHEIIILSDSDNEDEQTGHSAPNPDSAAGLSQQDLREHLFPDTPRTQTPSSTVNGNASSVAPSMPPESNEVRPENTFSSLLWPQGLASAPETASNSSSPRGSTHSSPASENHAPTDEAQRKAPDWSSSLLFPSVNIPTTHSKDRSSSTDSDSGTALDRQIDSAASSVLANTTMNENLPRTNLPGPQKGLFTKPPVGNVRKRVDDYNAAVSKTPNHKAVHPFFMTNTQKLGLQRAHRSTGSPAMQNIPMRSAISMSASVAPPTAENVAQSSILWNDSHQITQSSSMPVIPMNSNESITDPAFPIQRNEDPLAENRDENLTHNEEVSQVLNRSSPALIHPGVGRSSSSFERIRSPVGPRSMPHAHPRVSEALPSQPQHQQQNHSVHYVVDLTMSDDD